VGLDLWCADALRVRFYVLGYDGMGVSVGTDLVASGLRTGFGDDWLRLGAYKVVADGSSSGPTAATREPYASDSLSCGTLNRSQDDLDSLLLRAHRGGWQVTAHAVGDRAIESTLTAISRAVSAAPREGLRHRIEHCAMLPADLQDRVCKLRILPVMQPAFLWEFGDGYITNYGRHRADLMFPVRSLVKHGVVVAGSSDAPVTDHRALFGIQQAITRRTAAGDVCGPSEAVDLPTATRMHTINGAYASFEEARKGSIEVGKLADLVMLHEDITQVPSDNLADIPVAMTIVGGKVVHEASV
jgi:predicted amidohydrolase YtcJ